MSKNEREKKDLCSVRLASSSYIANATYWFLPPENPTPATYSLNIQRKKLILYFSAH